MCKVKCCLWFLLTTFYFAKCSATKRPHIVIILADDLGWNDVGFHGLNQIPTPNLDALAFSGVVLQNHYVAPICTPSRSALMTGKHPIHTGMQHSVIYGMEPRGLPLSERILPQYLKELGYKTHLVGKWHLGHYKKEYTPLYRGFDSHLGCWTGKMDYYDHTTVEHGTWGFDIRRGFDVAHELFGKYITDIISDEAVRLIASHNETDPLFILVSHNAVHSGNPYTPLRAPDELVDKFTNINDTNRKKFAGMLSKLDESVGDIFQALQRRGFLENSIVLFSTDNGGPAAGFNENAASNFPLRGVKNTLWEGGVRGAAALWSPLLQRRERIATQTIHISDWLPTLYAAAGGDPGDIPGLDGLNIWDALSRDLPSPRNVVLHNIDESNDNIYASASLTSDNWKLLKGTNYNGGWDQWYGPAGRDGAYDYTLTVDSKVGKSLTDLNMLPTAQTVHKLRNAATLVCNMSFPAVECRPLEAPCLFHIEYDPCEQRNMAHLKPELVHQLLQLLDAYNKTVVTPNNRPDDFKGDPKYWDRIYTNFGDYENPKINFTT